MSDEASSKKEAADPTNNLIVKAVVGVFGAVVAPVLVAMGLKFSDIFVSKVTEPPAAKTEAPKTDSEKDIKVASTDGGSKPRQTASATDIASTAPATSNPASSSTSVSSPPATTTPDPFMKSAVPVPNGPVVRLFNGRNLEGFHTYLGPPAKSKESIGSGRDPDKVFTVKKKELHISGQDWGVLVTDKIYNDYHLTVEFKWGEKTWFPRLKYARTSGILLHCNGDENAFKGWAPKSLKCQIIEGGTGDLVCLSTDAAKGRVSMTVEAEKVEVKALKKNPRTELRYRPGQAQTTLADGFVKRLGNGGDWKDETGFHRKGDVEVPPGEWNLLECICWRDQVTVRLNGRTVNSATHVKPSKGKIALQSHGSEIIFRKVDLQPLAAAMK